MLTLAIASKDGCTLAALKVAMLATVRPEKLHKSKPAPISGFFRVPLQASHMCSPRTASSHLPRDAHPMPQNFTTISTISSPRSHPESAEPEHVQLVDRRFSPNDSDPCLKGRTFAKHRLVFENIISPWMY